ncbi:MAG TPA: glutathione transferase GstA [Bdellovibrionales bacterium]|nr:glutathione transferase GstA [Bdellovibrionales bacterium]
MKLYYSPGACSLAVHIALIESGLPFDTVKTDIRAKTYDGGDYRKVNPKGSVPALQLDDGSILTEAAVVLQYIADQKPEKHLVPRLGTIERYRCQEWLNYVSSEIHKGFSPLWNPRWPEDAQAMTRDLLAGKFNFLSSHLEKHQFLMGDQFTVADAYLFTTLRWSKHLKVDLPKWPALLSYVERVQSRPSVQEALKREGLAS